MAWDNLKILAVVPARCGSKGIAEKNLKVIAGFSLIAWAAKTLNNISWIDHSIISTDSQKYADEGVSSGLDAPFLRPPELSTDLSYSIDVWAHAWSMAEKIYDKQFDISLLIEPTSPLREPIDIEKTVNILIEGNYSTAITVSRNPAHFTPEKTLKIDNEGILKPYLDSEINFSLRQKIPEYYYKNGICYAATRNAIMKDKEIFGNNCVGVVIERPVVNIDNKTELELAEFYLNKRNKN